MHVPDRRVAVPDGKQRSAVQHRAEVDGGIGASQFRLQRERLGQAFLERELDDLEGLFANGEREAQVGLGRHGGLPVGTDRSGRPWCQGAPPVVKAADISCKSEESY